MVAFQDKFDAHFTEKGVEDESLCYFPGCRETTCK